MKTQERLITNMVQLRHRPRPDEALIPCATAQSAPVVRPRAVPPPRPNRPAGIAREVLADLHAADAPVPLTAIRDAHDHGTWLPASAGLARVPLGPAPDGVELIDTDLALAAIAREYDAVADELETALAELAALAPYAVLPDWIVENLAKPHGKFRAAIHRADTSWHLTSVEPNVTVDSVSGEPGHLCHYCDDDPGRRADFTCWAPDSAITLLALAPVEALLKGSVAL